MGKARMRRDRGGQSRRGRDWCPVSSEGRPVQENAEGAGWSGQHVRTRPYSRTTGKRQDGGQAKAKEGERGARGKEQLTHK